ncbi:MAG: cyclic nucleotide-binding domain-containing protein [Cyanobacteria bacterium J06643_4]
MLRIALAKTPDQIDEVLKLRHHVLATENDRHLKIDESRRIDRFDAFPTTAHLVAIENNCIIGSLRLTMDSKAGLPPAVMKSARSVVPAGSKLISCDHYSVFPALDSPQITRGLVLAACYFALSEKATHLAASVSPAIARRLSTIGFKGIADEQAQSTLSRPPLMLDLRSDLDDSFIQFSHQHELQDLMHAYGCVLYKPGESILRAGTVGDCAFVIGEGTVEVMHPGNNDVIDTMGVGEVFGELALLTDHVRSADIFAKTEVRVMVLEKTIFVNYLMEDPKASLKLLQSMGHRMKHLIDHCNQMVA